MSEIKERCPHCPGELIVRSYGAPCRIFYYISCLNSDCRYLLKEFDTEQAAIEFANTRHRRGVTGWVVPGQLQDPPKDYFVIPMEKIHGNLQQVRIVEDWWRWKKQKSQ